MGKRKQCRLIDLWAILDACLRVSDTLLEFADVLKGGIPASLQFAGNQAFHRINSLIPTRGESGFVASLLKRALQ